MPEIVIKFFVFALGLIVGSFLNVCIYRMPRNLSIVKPRSFCPNCKKTVLWFDNIPLLSWIILGGKCRHCKAKISIQYFIVEALTACVFLILYKYFGLGAVFFIYLVFACGLIVASFIDIGHRIIPDEISLGGIVLGLLLSIMFTSLHNKATHLASGFSSLLGILIGGGIIYLTGIIGDFIFKKESMGGGDVKLLGMIGAFLGWPQALLSLCLASVYGSIVGVIVKIITKDSLIPFGPFLSLGALTSLFFYDKIIMLIFP
ncbi:MAG: prepilin peptidase [Candidatus Omnitrophota bacterium]